MNKWLPMMAGLMMVTGASSGPGDNMIGTSSGSGPGNNMTGGSSGPGNHNGNALGESGGKFIKPGSGVGLINPTHHVYYCDEPIEVKIVLPSSLDEVWDGTAQANVVAYLPGEEGVGVTPVLYWPIAMEDLIADETVSFYEELAWDCDNGLPPGEYQLALILTVADGASADPTLLENWYDGFNGLLSVVRVELATEAIPQDVDLDGEIDDDEDGDGYSDSFDDGS